MDCDSLVGIGHWPRSRKVGCLEFRELETRLGDEFVDLAIEVASAGDSLPYWRQPVLPGDDARIGGETVFQKNEASVRFEHAFDLTQRHRRIRDRTQRPRHDRRVDAAIRERECGLRRLCEEV